MMNRMLSTLGRNVSAGAGAKFVTRPHTFDPINIQSLNIGEKVLRGLFGGILSPFGFFSVPANHQVVLTAFGKYIGVKNPGLRFALPFGLVTKSVFMGDCTYKLPQSKVVDANGNPVIISALVNFRVKDPVRFAIGVDSNDNYMPNQAEACIKRVTSQYPYESSSGHSLKSESLEISDEMRTELQSACDLAGIHIDSVQITDLSYAEEIASQMLVRQQASAMMSARSEITEASLGLVQSAVDRLSLSPEGRERLTVNLMTALVSGNGAVTVLPLS